MGVLADVTDGGADVGIGNGDAVGRLPLDHTDRRDVDDPWFRALAFEHFLEQAGGFVPDASPGHRDAGQRWVGQLAIQVVVIDAEDRDVVGHADAFVAADLGDGSGAQVVVDHQRERPLQAAQPGEQLSDAIGAVPTAAGGGGFPFLLQLRARVVGVAKRALEPAGARQRPGDAIADEREVAVALAEEVLRAHLADALVVRFERRDVVEPGELKPAHADGPRHQLDRAAGAFAIDQAEHQTVGFLLFEERLVVVRRREEVHLPRRGGVGERVDAAQDLAEAGHVGPLNDGDDAAGCHIWVLVYQIRAAGSSDTLARMSRNRIITRRLRDKTPGSQKPRRNARFPKTTSVTDTV